MYESIARSLKSYLPSHHKRVYPPVGQCIYCGDTTDLTIEHIIPHGLGGKLELPESSCLKCCKLTSTFEHTCLRTMYGPLRLLYNLPSRRKKKRPKTLPLKVKLTPSDEWTYTKVEQEKYPFLILFPHLIIPKEISNDFTSDYQGPATNKFWIRGASPSFVFNDLLKQLVSELGVHSIMPEAKAQISEFCQMLAKIGHSFVVAEFGIDTFRPFLIPHILKSELADCDRFIGGLNQDEVPSNNLHELSIVNAEKDTLVIVRIRLLARLGTPTYYVVVGETTC